MGAPKFPEEYTLSKYSALSLIFAGVFLGMVVDCIMGKPNGVMAVVAGLCWLGTGFLGGRHGRSA